MDNAVVNNVDNTTIASERKVEILQLHKKTVLRKKLHLETE